MFRNTILKPLLSAIAVGGVLAVAQVSGPGLVTASPAITTVADYPAGVVTNTDLQLDKSRVAAGESNTARVTVSSGAGAPKGTVTFKVGGHQKTVVLSSSGTASYTMPIDLQAGRTYKVTASFNGGGAWRPSSDSAYVTVAGKRGGKSNSKGAHAAGGSSSNGSGSAGHGKGRAAPTTGGGTVAGEQTGGLPLVGSDASTTIYGLGGLVLLGAGGFVLVMHRRRSQAA